MDPRSVFHHEWLRSLREQYKHVVRSDDRVTLSSLTMVMHKVGFRDDELAQLRNEATMHIDDTGLDHHADVRILDTPKTAIAHPAECTCPECIMVDESQFDDEGQPITPDPAAQDFETGLVFPVTASGETADRIEAESVTFEDSVAAALRSDEAESERLSDEDENESDPDTPEQMSLF